MARVLCLTVNEALAKGAAATGDLAAVKVLMQRSFSMSSAHEAALEAAKCGYLHIVRYLVDELKVVAVGLQGVLREAATYGQLDVVRYLCERPAGLCPELNLDGTCALECAAKHGHVAVVRYLCELPTRHGVLLRLRDAFRFAVENGQLKVVKCLCELSSDREVNPAYFNNYPLRLAAVYGHLPIVQYLCELPAVDPRVLLQLGFERAVKDIARAAMEDRCRWGVRWSPLRAAWAGAVAAV
jgi:ankyrin repeat protein